MFKLETFQTFLKCNQFKIYIDKSQSRFLCSLRDNSLSFLLQENLKFKELVEGGGGGEKEKGSKQASGTNDAVLQRKMFAKI